jgi:hypothetical protein
MQRMQIRTLSPHFYNGAGGIALCMAALFRMTGRTQFRTWSLKAVAPLGWRLDRPSLCRQLVDCLGIGSGLGLGSLIYCLTAVASLLDAPELFAFARDCARLSTPERMARRVSASRALPDSRSAAPLPCSVRRRKLRSAIAVPMSARDALCCGNFGRIAFILQAGLTLQQPALVALARQRAAVRRRGKSGLLPAPRWHRIRAFAAGASRAAAMRPCLGADASHSAARSLRGGRSWHVKSRQMSRSLAAAWNPRRP